MHEQGVLSKNWRWKPDLVFGASSLFGTSSVDGNPPPANRIRAWLALVGPTTPLTVAV